MQRSCRYQTEDMFGEFVACLEVTRAHIATNLGTAQGSACLGGGAIPGVWGEGLWNTSRAKGGRRLSPEKL